MRRPSVPTPVQDWAGLPARWNVGSEFRYSPPPLDERTLVIAVTQSGETADTLAPARLARERGCALIAITNTVGSAITREADAVLFLQAGPEIAVVATKTFVTQVTTLVLLAAAMAKARGRLSSRARSGQLVDGAARAAGQGRARARAGRARPRSWPAATSTRAASCSSAAASRYPVALEGALKLKEVSYVHAEGYAAGELKHGPISLLDAEVPLVAVATRSLGPGEAHQQRHGGPRPGCPGARRRRPKGDGACRDFADDILWVPDTIEALSPVLAIIPLQLFAYHTAVARGTDVDQPRNLAKSVTVE